MNGTIGVVSSLEDNEIEVEIEGEKFPIERHTLEFLRYELDPETHALVEHVYTRFTQFPVKLALALTSA